MLGQLGLLGDEGGVAGEVDAVVVAAQDRPFDQLARDRIADRLLHLGRLRRLALARKRDRLLRRVGDVEAADATW